MFFLKNIYASVSGFTGLSLMGLKSYSWYVEETKKKKLEYDALLLEKNEIALQLAKKTEEFNKAASDLVKDKTENLVDTANSFLPQAGQMNDSSASIVQGISPWFFIVPGVILFGCATWFTGRLILSTYKTSPGLDVVTKAFWEKGMVKTGFSDVVTQISGLDAGNNHVLVTCISEGALSPSPVSIFFGVQKTPIFLGEMFSEISNLEEELIRSREANAVLNKGCEDFIAANDSQLIELAVKSEEISSLTSQLALLEGRLQHFASDVPTLPEEAVASFLASIY